MERERDWERREGGGKLLEAERLVEGSSHQRLKLILDGMVYFQVVRSSLAVTVGRCRF